jgi:anti-sigma factor RsiW
MSESTEHTSPPAACERLLEYVYGELDAEARAAFATHLEGCERCKAELGAWERVRGAVKGALPTVEPPAAALGPLHAQLLHAAAQRPRRGKVLQLFRRAARHPGYAAAAGLVLIGGIIGWQFSHGRVAMNEAAEAPPVAAPVTPAAAAPEPVAAPPPAAAPVEEPVARVAAPAPPRPSKPYAAMPKAAMPKKEAAAAEKAEPKLFLDTEGGGKGARMAVRRAAPAGDRDDLLGGLAAPSQAAGAAQPAASSTVAHAEAKAQPAAPPPAQAMAPQMEQAKTLNAPPAPSVQVLRKQAEEAAAAGRCDEAVKLYQQLEKQYPTAALTPKERLPYVYCMRGRTQEAQNAADLLQRNNNAPPVEAVAAEPVATKSPAKRAKKAKAAGGEKSLNLMAPSF